jgi:succinate-semialdehyde dehydrogenase/glutarate-semialdehyde dehydrogenase
VNRDVRPFLLGGDWTLGHKEKSFPVHDPATGRILAEVADASPVDAIRALDEAVATSSSWAATAPRTRGEVLRRSWELLEERRDEFAGVMSREMGKTLAESHGEITYGGEFLRWFAEEAVRVGGTYGLNPEGNGRIVVAHRPVGPALLITPWNFPLAMATRKVAPAFAAGCTVILKPAEATPLTALLFGQLLIDAGTPSGVLSVLPTISAPEVVSALLEDPRLRKLSFTGSTAVGRVLLAQSARNITRTSMELGGNAPFLVFEDADLDAAVDGAMIAKFRNSGQACTAANRFLVHEPVAEEFARRFAAEVSSLRLGPGTDPASDVGPLIDGRAVERATSLVADAVARGARVLAGGQPSSGPGSFFSPTLLTDVPSNARMVTEEIFAPLAGIATFHDEQEAIRMANATEFGLAAYAYTRDLDRVQRLMDRLEAGMLGVNSGLISNAAAPFGGIKHSGLGREGGALGINEYLDVTYTHIPAPVG